ncbi:MAG: ADP-glyceromanno-heptose 6-epimerase [Bacteroidota bacterium]
MIVITGATGFIGSVLVSRLNKEGYSNLILVDDFSSLKKAKNLDEKHFIKKVDRDDFFQWFDDYNSNVDLVLHIGARTDTTEFDSKIFDVLNLEYSKQLWQRCSDWGIPFIYASSAATYGLGEFGYVDNHKIVNKLKPLNPYGVSKNDFDIWVLKQKETPPFWAGLKFFNVYGPNEYHKDRMASVILHAFGQINNTAQVKLFKSHKPEYKDGEQLRDFIYVLDVVDVIFFLMRNKPESGIYNLGTGKARTFVDLAIATFTALQLDPKIEFIDTPEDIRDKYQYFTEAKMEKLRDAGYKKAFTSLEAGINDYVVNYLANKNYY